MTQLRSFPGRIGERIIGLMKEEKRLYTVRELREAVGHDLLGEHLAYSLARLHGFRLGKRLVVPAHVVEALLEGKLDLEAALLEARKRRGRA
ncbi:hypothetical protein TthTF19_14360 [Thermus thermophilus]